MFNFGDNVDRDKVDKVERAGDSRLSTNRRQIGDNVDSRLCRQCVPGLKVFCMLRQFSATLFSIIEHFLLLNLFYNSD